MCTVCRLKKSCDNSQRLALHILYILRSRLNSLKLIHETTVDDYFYLNM
jgi:hypothetical protein